MSSETSTKPASARGRRTRVGNSGTPRQRASAEPRGSGEDTSNRVAAAADDSLRPAHLLVIGVVACASVAVIMAHGASPASIVLIALTVVAAGGTSAALFRTLWPLATDAGLEEPEMLGGRTRAALEREKAVVLRAIKELEFDRAMGKVSGADCEEMTARLRARAVRIIRQLDAGSASYRELIEKEVQARLRV